MYRVVQCSVVKYLIVQCSILKYRVVQCSAVTAKVFLIFASVHYDPVAIKVLRVRSSCSSSHSGPLRSLYPRYTNLQGGAL